MLVGRKWYSALKDSSRFSLPSYCISLLSEIMTNLDSVLKSRDITLSTKVHRVQVIYIYIYFPSSHVWMKELGNKKRLNARELMPSNFGAGEDS